MKLSTTSRLDMIVRVLTIVSVIPFDSGPISLIMPPTWRPYITALGLVLGIVLQELKTQKTEEK